MGNSRYSSLQQCDQQHDEDLEIQTTLGQQQTITSIAASRKDNPRLDVSTTTRSKETLFSDGAAIRNKEETIIPGPFLPNEIYNQQDDNKLTINQRRTIQPGPQHYNTNDIAILPTYCIKRTEPVTIILQKLPQSKARFQLYFCLCRCIYFLTLLLLLGGIISWFVMKDLSMDMMKRIVQTKLVEQTRS